MRGSSGATAGTGTEVGACDGAGVSTAAGVVAMDGAIGGGMALLLVSRTSCLEPPRAVATACSNRDARLCTIPIQLPATCTTARLASRRTSCACCDNNIRVEGSSRLPRICCHSSGSFVLGADAGLETVGSSGDAAGAGFGLGAGASVAVAAAAGAAVAGAVGAAGVVGLIVGGVAAAAS